MSPGQHSTCHKLCRRCHSYFNSSDEKERSSGCHYHHQSYVNRYHPEGERYYAAVEENPKHKGWHGSCWECCGAEEKDAPGCTWGPHVTYDD
ncbi:hypothetical protein BESB_044140 [Besnoitia besnoiti]|uniref:Uncharacterized protein n=1 Tax=Besnoitia besnoiti TaxID=94643 RepID=A0A2A9MLA2_BESBE|nr:hypothetical protein BESB_044140 [Besnoitia besnoiti]PFH36222.1 hypothetical protein BESB_044140 [Besnoitia besnoiti]